MTPITPIPVAHAGHVLVDLLTVAPVLVLILWFAIVTIRDRRRGIDRDEPSPEQTLAEDDELNSG